MLLVTRAQNNDLIQIGTARSRAPVGQQAPQRDDTAEPRHDTVCRIMLEYLALWA